MTATQAILQALFPTIQKCYPQARYIPKSASPKPRPHIRISIPDSDDHTIWIKIKDTTIHIEHHHRPTVEGMMVTKNHYIDLNHPNAEQLFHQTLQQIKNTPNYPSGQESFNDWFSKTE